MIDPAARRFVLASGPPGPGKTSLAAPLAARVCRRPVAEDTLRER